MRKFHPQVMPDRISGWDSAQNLGTLKWLNSLSYIPIKHTSDMPMGFGRLHRYRIFFRIFVIHMNSAVEKHQIGIDLSNPFTDPGINRRTQET